MGRGGVMTNNWYDILHRVDTAKRLWSLFIPNVPLPEDRSFGLWCEKYPDDIIQRVLSRVGRKFHNYHGDAEIVYRYTTGTLRNAANRATLIAEYEVWEGRSKKSTETGSQ